MNRPYLLIGLLLGSCASTNGISSDRIARFSIKDLFVDRPFVYFGESKYSEWRSVADLQLVEVEFDSAFFDPITDIITVSGHTRSCCSDSKKCQVLVGRAALGGFKEQSLPGGLTPNIISNAKKVMVASDGGFSITAPIDSSSYLFVAPDLGCLMRVYQVGKLTTEISKRDR